MSPTTNTSGWPRREQSRSTLIRPARSTSAPDASASFFASGEADTPAAQIVVFAGYRGDGAVCPFDVDTVGVDRGNDASGVNRHPGLLKRSRRLCRQPVAERGEDLLSPLEQHDLNLGRIEPAEVVLQGAPRQLGDLSRDLDAGRTATDDDEGQPRPACLGIILQLGHLEGTEDPLSLQHRIG